MNTGNKLKHFQNYGIFFLTIFFITISILFLNTAAAEKEEQTKSFPRTKFPLVDEAGKDQDFFMFRQKLITAVEKKNVDFILKHLDEKIHNNFGNGGGVKEFIDSWNLKKDPLKSDLWPTLMQVLKLGGGWSELDGVKTFVAPYTFAFHPDMTDEMSNDISDFSVIIGENVKARSAPRSDAQVVEVLSYELVRQIYSEHGKEVYEKISGERYPWVKVIIYDGREAYVFGKYCRSLLDYRAAFQKKNGDWKMIFFIAGD
jgi:hypothetical protein